VEADRPRTDATVNRYQSALSAVFQAALRGRWGWVVENPVRAVARGKESPGRVRFLSEDEVGPSGETVKGERTRLLEACKTSECPLLHLLVSLALSTGARRGELLGLRWADVDLARSVAYLETSKNKDRRALPLIPAVREALLEARRQAAQGAQSGDVVRDIRQDLVFRSAHDPAKPFNYEKDWRAARDAEGVEGFRFHDLRHSAASCLAMNGATLLEIADVLGHRTLQMVRRYSHLSHDHKAALLNRVMPKVVG
jgi:integrase